MKDIKKLTGYWNRTMAIMDCLDFLRTLPDESIDLATIDPPFAKNETFKKKLKRNLTEAEIIAEQTFCLTHGIRWDLTTGTAEWLDKWEWNTLQHPDLIEGLRKHNSALASFLDSVIARDWIDSDRKISGKSAAAYLGFMAVVFVELHRVLTKNGSIFVHCDHTASRMIGNLLDIIFGGENFRNEIAWCYSSGGASARYFARKHDTIWWYSKSDAYTFNTLRQPHTSVISDSNRHLFNPDGKIMLDWWNDIPYLHHKSSERTGYPTQKPLKLLDRIIQAASNPGDVVLDCFAGCATAVVSADRNDRQWLACDSSVRAMTMVAWRFAETGIGIVNPDTYTGEVPLSDNGTKPTMIGINDIKDRLNQYGWEQYDWKLSEKSPSRGALRRDPEAAKMFKWCSVQAFGPRCWACGFQERYEHMLEVDHVRPVVDWNDEFETIRKKKPHNINEIQKSMKSAMNAFGNMQVLCAECNKVKGTSKFEKIETFWEQRKNEPSATREGLRSTYAEMQTTMMQRITQI